MSPASYHHGNLREALVEAAVSSARERGTDGLALRELARQVGVSHNAAYRHFADRDALVTEVALRGLAGLVAAMQRRLHEIDQVDPVDQARAELMGLGRGYVDFAVAEKGLFTVMFAAYPDPAVEPVDDLVADADPFGMLNDALDRLVEVGFLDPAARPGAEITCWAAVHGFGVLHTDGPLHWMPFPDREAALVVMLEALDRAYGATTRTDWGPLPT